MDLVGERTAALVMAIHFVYSRYNVGRTLQRF